MMHAVWRLPRAAATTSLLALLCCGLLAWSLLGEVGPVLAAEPHGLAIRQDRHGVTVDVDGGPFAAYVIDQANKPYLWPVIGPTGKAMTRAFPMQELPDEPAAQRDHPHHRGITFGHEHMAGSDSWHERATFAKDAEGSPRLASLGSIVHRDFSLLTVDGERAVIEELCDHLDPAGKPVVTERRRLTFRADKAKRTIDIDQEFRPAPDAGPSPIGDNKDAGLFVRVPTSMAVDSKQGGKIVNSEGQFDADAWSKPARWCDYHGPASGENLGIAILNHPTSYRHPTRWHVRTYGLFAANPFASKSFNAALPDASTTLAPGDVLRLHHRILLHTGDEQAAAVDDAWQQYAREIPAPITVAD
jgi:hypothetical protein